MFPILGPLGAVMAALGLWTLIWYERLSKEDKEKYDRLAAHYASSLYNTGVEKLTRDQFAHVHSLVKGHFNK